MDICMTEGGLSRDIHCQLLFISSSKSILFTPLYLKKNWSSSLELGHGIIIIWMRLSLERPASTSLLKQLMRHQTNIITTSTPIHPRASWFIVSCLAIRFNQLLLPCWPRPWDLSHWLQQEQLPLFITHILLKRQQKCPTKWCITQWYRCLLFHDHLFAFILLIIFESVHILSLFLQWFIAVESFLSVFIIIFKLNDRHHVMSTPVESVFQLH